MMYYCSELQGEEICGGRFIAAANLSEKGEEMKNVSPLFWLMLLVCMFCLAVLVMDSSGLLDDFIGVYAGLFLKIKTSL